MSIDIVSKLIAVMKDPWENRPIDILGGGKEKPLNDLNERLKQIAEDWENYLPQTTTSGTTSLLSEALKDGKHHYANYFIELKPAIVHLRNKYGWTPLFELATLSPSHASQISFLIEKRADVNAESTSESIENAMPAGATPLFAALRSDCRGTILALLDYGATVKPYPLKLHEFRVLERGEEVCSNKKSAIARAIMQITDTNQDIALLIASYTTGIPLLELEYEFRDVL